MKVFIISMILFMSLSVFAVDCERNPIYCQILRNKPNINKTYAMELSNLISKYSGKYGLDPKISVCIAYQENRFRNKHRYQTVAVHPSNCTESEMCGLNITRGISDFGVFQIHINTANNYKLDINRLETDLEYAVEAHFTILKSKIKICDYLQEDSWTCYHSNTKHLRLYYKKLIEDKCVF